MTRIGLATIVNAALHGGALATAETDLFQPYHQMLQYFGTGFAGAFQLLLDLMVWLTSQSQQLPLHPHAEQPLHLRRHFNCK